MITVLFFVAYNDLDAIFYLETKISVIWYSKCIEKVFDNQECLLYVRICNHFIMIQVQKYFYMNHVEEAF